MRPIGQARLCVVSHSPSSLLDRLVGAVLLFCDRIVVLRTKIVNLRVIFVVLQLPKRFNGENYKQVFIPDATFFGMANSRWDGIWVVVEV